jgi:hypothetical protein
MTPLRRVKADLLAAAIHHRNPPVRKADRTDRFVQLIGGVTLNHADLKKGELGKRPLLYVGG